MLIMRTIKLIYVIRDQNYLFNRMLQFIRKTFSYTQFCYIRPENYIVYEGKRRKEEWMKYDSDIDGRNGNTLARRDQARRMPCAERTLLRLRLRINVMTPTESYELMDPFSDERTEFSITQDLVRSRVAGIRKGYLKLNRTKQIIQIRKIH